MTVRLVRILLVDDHRLLRETLRDVLCTEEDFAVVGEAGDGDEAVVVASATRPDVILLDVDMPRHEPVESARRLLGVSPNSKIIVLSMHDGPDLVRDMIKAGVIGFVHKSVGRSDLAGAIRGAAHEGRMTIAGVSLTAITATDTEVARPLSAREQEVLSLVAAALSNRQIATRLSITEGTVKRHLRNIFGKLGVTSRIEAVNKVAGRPIGGRWARF